MKRLFVSGIGTDVGKTVAAAVLAKAWGMGYWKPVQAGELEQTDSDKVREWTRDELPVFPESFRLQHPMSPHAAAEKDGLRIELSELRCPEHQAPLLVEGAGGLLVPLNDEGESMLDLARTLQAEVLLVSQHFLGSINQTLLSCEVLERRGVPVRGVLFSGPANEESERIITRMSPFPILGRIPEMDPGPVMVDQNAREFSELPPFHN